MKAPRELQRLWLEVLIRSVNRCEPKGHECLSVYKGTWMLKHVRRSSSHVILHGILLSAPYRLGKPCASDESVLGGCDFALLLNGPDNGGGVLSPLPSCAAAEGLGSARFLTSNPVCLRSALVPV